MLCRTLLAKGTTPFSFNYILKYLINSLLPYSLYLLQLTYVLNQKLVEFLKKNEGPIIVK